LAPSLLKNDLYGVTFKKKKEQAKDCYLMSAIANEKVEVARGEVGVL
jgi:hypothetical protein